MILVGGQGLLHAGAGAERDPAVRDRRRAETPLRECDEATLDGVPHGGDDTADVVGRRVLADQPLHDAGQAAADRGHAGDVLLLGDVTDEVDGVGLLQPVQIGAGEHAHRAAVGDEWEVVDRALDHGEHQLERQRVRRGGDRVRCHDLADRAGGLHTAGENPRAQVLVGDDAGKPVAVYDQ